MRKIETKPRTGQAWTIGRKSRPGTNAGDALAEAGRCPTAGPWRDGRAIVLDPEVQVLPPICIVTGRTVDGAVRPVIVEPHRWGEPRLTISGCVADVQLPPPTIQRGLVLALGPGLLIFSVWALFNVQFNLGADLDRQPLVLNTFLWLTSLIISLGGCLFAPMLLASRPARPRLRCVRREGRLIWIHGAHPALLVQLPELPSQPEA